MTDTAITLEMDLVTAPLDERRRQELATLLIDAVASGASVGFVDVPSTNEANAYWDSVFQEVEDGTRLVLLASEQGRIVGSVQLAFTWKCNGNHRGEVQKLLIHTSCRRRGIGTALMVAIEDEAIARKRHLLILDTIANCPAHHLYEKLGYIRAGVIPGFARSTKGALQTTAIYYRDLRDADADHLGESAARHWDFAPKG